MKTFKKILFPIDFSDCSTSVFPFALDLAEKPGVDAGELGHLADRPARLEGVADVEEPFPVGVGELLPEAGG